MSGKVNSINKDMGINELNVVKELDLIIKSKEDFRIQLFYLIIDNLIN